MANTCANSVLMIRPVRFRCNPQTVVNNYFQYDISGISDEEVQKIAAKEFDGVVNVLRDNGVEVLVVNDSLEPDTPDSIFPNNWITTHQDGSVCLFPMFAPNRRLERRSSIVEEDLPAAGFRVRRVVDYSRLELESIFLEGTGSLVLEHEHKIAFASLSPRTHPEGLRHFCHDFGYDSVIFTSSHGAGRRRKQIYHTNVMMFMADSYCVICLDAIDDFRQRSEVVSTLSDCGKEIIEIDQIQVDGFVGNMLQLGTARDELVLIMSDTALASSGDELLARLKNHNPIIHAPIPTIERVAGGGVRCMMAEIFLPKA